MAKIAPSILSADFANLERDIRNIGEHLTQWVMIRIADRIADEQHTRQICVCCIVYKQNAIYAGMQKVPFGWVRLFVCIIYASAIQ